jgi:hypothetical protein
LLLGRAPPFSAHDRSGPARPPCLPPSPAPALLTALRSWPPRGARTPATADGWRPTGPTTSPSSVAPHFSLLSRFSSRQQRPNVLARAVSAAAASPPPNAAATPPTSNSSRPLLRGDPPHLVLPPAAANVKVRGPILAGLSSLPLAGARLRAGGLLYSFSFFLFARTSFA